MPPFVPRKKQRSPSAVPTPPVQRTANPQPTTTKRSRPTLFDTVDAPNKKRRTLVENQKLLDKLNDEDDDESLSDIDSDEFEDVPSAKGQQSLSAEEGEDGSEDDVDWEDAIAPTSSAQATASVTHDPGIGDVSITINEDGRSYQEYTVSAGVNKKGPSKRQRQVRIDSHCLHVQALMWHNTIRNAWVNDKEVQSAVVDSLTEGVKREITLWRGATGTLSKEDMAAKKAKAAARSARGKRGRKSKDKSGRDWGYDAGHVEQGVPNLAHGDPLLRLLKVLTAYWRKRFTVTAPGLRKQGYKPLRRLRGEIKGWEKNSEDVEAYGERTVNLQQFQKLARSCEGSRDVGAQLYVALLRGLGIEARMVANLQPIGFGWSKAEEADESKRSTQDREQAAKGVTESDDEVVEIQPRKLMSSKELKRGLNTEKPTRRSSRGNRAEPIDLDESDSPLSSLPSPPEAIDLEDDDDLSIMEITPPARKRRPTKKFDRDLAFPNYWAEVCSPISNKWIPVDPIVLSTIASNDELLQTFEPRGKKAEKAKQVMCYTVAFSNDGTAKDVTVRYLKKHQLPGKTKGMRMPVEKVPIYNRRGKVKKYEEYDWFRTVMSLYDRPEHKRTTADDLEEQTDLKPFKPNREDREVEKESLQWYKQSAEYVLEQHLRREEAIVPGAQPVKTFMAGKGDKAKEHPVFLREDVVTCKTVESWHKEGRALKPGEQPMKLVPMRAVTLIRKREMEDAQRETGEKLKQGLYSTDQTDWIIPPPIENGIIPKNAFGNMDVYVPTMVPEGAVHIPLKGTAKICKKLDIDFAEACTGFEFGKQRAVPVLTGVVVAEEYEILVRDAWKEEQKEIKRKEDTKRTGVSLHWWRKMLLGLRVLERMKLEYANAGAKEEEYNPFVAKAHRKGRSLPQREAAEDLDGEAEAGGFFLPGQDGEEILQSEGNMQEEHEDRDECTGSGGGFLIDDELDHNDAKSSLLIEEPGILARAPPKNHAPITPVSLQSMHKATNGFDDTADTEPGRIDVLQTRTNKARKKSAAGPIAKQKANAGLRKATALIEAGVDGEDDSSLSDLSEPSDDTGDFEHNLTLSVGSKSSRSLPVTRKPWQTPSKKRITPLKSQYFLNGDDEDIGEDDGTEIEVVKPRRTTPRKKAKK